MSTQLSVHRVQSASVLVRYHDNFVTTNLTITDSNGSETEIVLYADQAVELGTPVHHYCNSVRPTEVAS